jgi:hypothetical protein
VAGAGRAAPVADRMIGGMFLSPWVLAVLLALIVIATIPTRRLFMAGAGRGLLTAYLVALVALGLLATSGRGPDRLLVPCLVVGFAAPLVAPRALVRRLLRRTHRDRRGGPPRDVV